MSSDETTEPVCPDDIVGNRLGPIADTLYAMCGVTTIEYPNNCYVYDSIVAAIRQHSEARLRDLPYWIQLLVLEAEDITAEAKKTGMTLEDVIAWRAERRAKEASRLRHWYLSRHQSLF